MKHAFINQPVEVPGLRPELAALIGAPGYRDVLRLWPGNALRTAPTGDVRHNRMTMPFAGLLMLIAAVLPTRTQINSPMDVARSPVMGQLYRW